MPITQADIEQAGPMLLGGASDPRTGAGLDAGYGAIYVLGDPKAPTAVLQKQSQIGGNPNSWAPISGGGGGSGAPVVLVDPVAPALNEQWILRQPPAGAPTPAEFDVTVNAPSVAGVSVQATCLIVLTAQPVPGPVFFLQAPPIQPGVVLSYTAGPPGPNQIQIGATTQDTANNIAAFFNTAPAPAKIASAVVVAGPPGAWEVHFTADPVNFPGGAGNAIFMKPPYQIGMSSPSGGTFAGGGGAAGTQYTATDPVLLGPMPIAISAGVNWIPGGNPIADATAVAAAMTAAWGAAFTVNRIGNLIKLTRNVAGVMPPGTNVTFNGVPNPGASTIANITPGTNGIPEAYTYKVKGATKVFTLPFN